ncbi:MAG: NifU family protein [Gordonia sp. (in: high G+C Gram-positive bacteria)]|uniref:NifU family protein n=1 Tax=Gordonia sp. (in: high G+C Gram-positive bacteria) TaxID=84139 RepID=UPI003BB5B685
MITTSPVHLRPEPAGDDPQLIVWRVGPGLIRQTGNVPPELAPTAIQRLMAEGVLAAVSVAPGRIDTQLSVGHTAAVNGPAIRSALFHTLCAPGGWPDAPGQPHTDSAAVTAAADREITDAVEQVLAGEFGVYTASHGGVVTLLRVTAGRVHVQLSGRCHGCAFADNTIRRDLVTRLSPIPGFAGVVVGGDTDCTPATLETPATKKTAGNTSTRTKLAWPSLRRERQKNSG